MPDPAKGDAGPGRPRYWWVNLARAEHPRNFSFPLEGPSQSNNRAELTAVIRVLQTEPRPLEIRPDSEVVESGLRVLLAGGGYIQLRDVCNLRLLLS